MDEIFDLETPGGASSNIDVSRASSSATAEAMIATERQADAHTYCNEC